MRRLIFGCGYLGRRVADRWLESGDEVFAVTRRRERAKELSAAGLVPIIADVTQTDSLAGLPACETVLFAVGFDRAAGALIRDVYAGGLKSTLAALPAEKIARFIYISSTGVYGQTGGEWVDEQSPCEPSREGGRACLEAERVLAAHSLGPRAIVLRLAGLYGPGRIPRAADLQEGRPVPARESGWLNLIHVEDAAEIVLVAAARSSAPRTYVVSDGCPVERREYLAELARLLDAPPPRFALLDESTTAARRRGSEKRVSNSRLLRELAPRMAYPSYREGLAEIVASELTPASASRSSAHSESDGESGPGGEPA